MTKRRSRRPLRLFWSSFGHLGLVIDWSLGVKGPRWSLIERQWPPVSCPLPPVPCLLSPAPLPPDSRPLIPQPRPSLSAENLKELLQSAGASRVFARVKQPLPGPIQIELEQEPDAMGAALLVANGVDAIPVAHRQLPGVGWGTVNDTAAHSRMPMSGLFESIKIFDRRGRGGAGHCPMLVRIQGHGVIARQQA